MGSNFAAAPFVPDHHAGRRRCDAFGFPSIGAGNNPIINGFSTPYHYPDSMVAENIPVNEASAIPSTGDRSDAHVESQDQLWADSRIAERSSMLLMADICTPDGASRASARIRNLSARGLMAECAWPSPPGAPVRFTLRGVGETAGRIAWNDGMHIGVAFDRPIDPRLTRKAAERTGTPVMVPTYLQGEPISLLHSPGHPPKGMQPPPFGKRI